MQRIWDKMRQLVTYDPNLTVFGAASHRYRIYPRLAEAEIAGFEQKHNVTLPEDYRRFLMEIANGGAGPYYGLQRLDAAVHKGSDHLISRSWLHHAAWNLNYRQFPTVEEYNEVYHSDEQTQGALYLSHMGCGHEVLLVVAGEESGTVWEDYRGSDEGIVPVQHGTDPAERVSFSGWYEMWLDKNLAS
jgi:hypothetical protein